MMQSDQMQDWNNEATNVANRLPPAFNHVIWSEYPSGAAANPMFPTANAVLAEMNNRYGLFSWFGHGEPNHIVTMSDEYNTAPRNCLNTIDAIDNREVTENNDGLDCLTNENFPALCYSISCNNTPFDDYKINNYPGRNLGEGFTVISNNGGPAFLGNTRYGWVGISYHLYEGFADLITLNSVDPDDGTSCLHLGVGELVSKQIYNDHYLRYSHNLVGCPETKIWTNTPAQFTNVSFVVKSTSITVNSNVISCDICASSGNNGASYHEVAHNTSSYTFNTSVRPLYITITKHNYIPYCAVTGGTFSTNENWSGRLFVRADLSFSSNAQLTIEPGADIRFLSGAQLTINGSINAQGSESDVIHFTSASSSPAPGNWDGILINNTDDPCIIEYATVEYAVYGVQCQFSSPVSITHSTLHHNQNGIYVRSSASNTQYVDILYNTISQNTNYGLYFYDDQDTRVGNTLITQNSQHGIYSRTNADPIIRSMYVSENDYGHNTVIANGSAGIRAQYSSYPQLGNNYKSGNTDKYGYNEINDNTGYEVDNRNSSGMIYAERNYWSANHYDQYATPDDVYGNVDWNPIQYEIPTGAAFAIRENSLAKSHIAFDEAHRYEVEENYNKAIVLYLKLLSEQPDAENVSFGISGLIRCYKSTNRHSEIINLMDELIHANPGTTTSNNAKDHSLPFLVKNGDYDIALDRAQELLELNRGSALFEPHYLYQIATINQIKSGGLQSSAIAKAMDTYRQLLGKYPDSDFGLLAELELKNNSDGGFVKEQSNEVNLYNPSTFALYQNYPNPFNPCTTIRYDLAKDSYVILKIYNINGQLVTTLLDKKQAAGLHDVKWDGTGVHGENVSNGVYFYRLIAGEVELSDKMLLLR